jgi:hypothetical protein
MRRFHLLGVLLVLLVPPAMADPLATQDRRERIEIDSRILGATRQIVVQLPEGYADDPDRTYPVLFLTDAQWQFDLVAATFDYHAYWGRIPDHIIVGLYNPVRNADLVPEPDPRYPSTGSGDTYLAHVTEEVLPGIAERYRTNGIRLLFGHSFGGVMTLNQLLSRPEAFNAYIALGSSTWVSERVLFERLEAAADRDFGDAVLYMAVGETDGGATVPDGVLFAERLEALSPQGFDWVFEITPGENHFTNVPEGMHRAIAHIYPFAGQQAGLTAAGEAGGATGVAAWFAAQEARLGWRFVPQTMELSLAGFALGNDGHGEAAQAVFDALERRFPDNVEVVAVRANTLGQSGDVQAAISAIDRAIALGEREGHPADRLQAFRDYRSRLEGRMGEDQDP